MTRATALAWVLLAAAGLRCADAQAQARGPSAKQVQEEGQRLPDAAERRARSMETYMKLMGIEPEVLASTEPLDEAGRASRNAEQAAWLTQLIGRFRVGGRVEKRDYAFLEGNPDPAARDASGDISGVADCAAIGAGAGVHCIINATWPVIESEIGDFMQPPPPSERVRTFRPAVLVLGLIPNTAEIRVSMVTDDSVAHMWRGRLEAYTLTARRSSSCGEGEPGTLRLARTPPMPCFQPAQITIEPGSNVILMVHKALGVTMKLSLLRDPTAAPKKPMKTKKVR